MTSDSWWLLPRDRGRKPVRFVRLALNVVIQSHADFVNLLEVLNVILLSEMDKVVGLVGARGSAVG